MGVLRARKVVEVRRSRGGGRSVWGRRRDRSAPSARVEGFLPAMLAVVLVGSLLGLLPAGPAAAAPARPATVTPPAPVATGPAVHGVTAVPSRARVPADPSHPFAATATRWPAAGSARLVAAPPTGGAAAGAKARGVGVPVWVQALAGKSVNRFGATGQALPASLDVTVRDSASARSAGVSGVLFTVGPAAGTGGGRIRVGLDYAGFAQAYGGNYGSRLRLVSLPVCALSTPRVAGCRTATPLSSTNDVSARSVWATVSLPAAGTAAPLVLAAVADGGAEGGPAGSYTATTLKPSGSWTSGSDTGSFDYSVPVTVPSAVSPLVPQVGLSYDSGSVDGQTSATGAQSSWVGDGWSTPSSFIEQSFLSCADKPEGTAAPFATSDECYDGPILSVSLDGSSSSLVWDSGQSVWKAQNDNGEVITHVTGSGNGSGTYNTDYWVITQRDGTMYEFGRNELPGWTSGKPATNSVDSEPVYSAHPGDPCYHASGFTSSVCTMAYRWNLDYVKDIHGNAMAYYYHQDTNFYGEDFGTHDVSYVRDDHLDHIDYGFTDPGAYGTVPDRVQFTTADRCLSGPCDPLTATTAPNWPDVPFDLVCAAGATCSSISPSFFSTVRLASISTQQYSTATGTYQTVDSYALAQTLPAPDDLTSPALWLASITHTGSDLSGGATTAVTMPPVTFTPTAAMPNRVDTSSGLPAFDRFRLGAVTTESGSVISPTYALVGPCTTPVTQSPSANTASCYPVYWTPDGFTTPFLDWFNKYAVTKVTQTDPTGGAPAMVTSYAYTGGAAWHYDDNELVQAKYRTYGQFRGFADVTTYTGDGANDRRTQSENRYYRGMSDDNNTTAVTLTDSQGGHHDDTDQFAGSVLETIAYLGEGGPVDHGTITSYWLSTPTATRTRAGLPALTANTVAIAETYTRQAVTDGGTTTWRATETDSTYDTTGVDIGLLSRTYTHTVPADTAHDSCASRVYAPANTAANLVGLVAGAETDSVACGGFTEGTPASTPAAFNTLTAPAAVSRPAQVESDAQTFYDDPSFSTTFPQTTAPSRGDATMVRAATGYAGGAFTYQTSARSTYDGYGRVVAAYDADGNETTTAYTMNAVGLTTGTTATNPLGQTTTTTLDPVRGLTLTSSDLNAVVTTSQYDALGRITSMWLDSRSAGAPANYTYSYQVSRTAANAVTTNTLDEGMAYLPSTTIYDAQLRTRQTQTWTPQGGRLVTDSFYDSRGWVTASNGSWWDAATAPNTTLITAADLGDQVPATDLYTYDGLGRTIIDASDQYGVEVSRHTTVYNGDRTTVIPSAPGPAAGSAVVQATVTDPTGRKSELDQYTAAPTLHTPADPFTGTWYVTGGTALATGYGYDGHGNPTTVTDPAGNSWTSTYNLLGQVTDRTDPDTGHTAMLYDGNGNLTQVTDSRGMTISYTYDALNRKTGQYDATLGARSSANQMAAWVYDNANNAVPGMTDPIGRLTTETAYRGGAAYTVQHTNFNVFGESLGEKVTIPSATEGSLLGTTYAFSHVYTANTGLPLKDIYPAAGGLPAETILHGFTRQYLPNAEGGLVGYAQNTTYDAWGRVAQETIGAGTNLATLTNAYDPHTGLLTDQLVKRQVTTPATVDEQNYVYDPWGNVTRQVDTQAGTTADTQCYGYDSLSRLIAAWTATDNCATAPTAANHAMVGDPLGAASAYWTTWTFRPTEPGERNTQIQHAVAGGADTTTAYTYPGTGQPDTLTGTTATGGTPGTTTYGYDSAGNMTTRAAGQGNQTLSWNDADQLTAVAASGVAGNTAFVYDADGNLLIQRDPTTTTLYLPGEQITLDKTSQFLHGTRYIALPGGGTVVRTGTATAAYTFEITDQHGTPRLYLDNTSQTPTWRQSSPYGATRGTPGAVPDNHGFLNDVADTATGLTEVGARQYDPSTGAFISHDPVSQAADPQQLNGYGYGGGNPVTHSDPTGLCYQDPTSGDYLGINCGLENQGTPTVTTKLDNGDGPFRKTTPTCPTGKTWVQPPLGGGSGKCVGNTDPPPKCYENSTISGQQQCRTDLEPANPYDPYLEHDAWEQWDFAWEWYKQSFAAWATNTAEGDGECGMSGQALYDDQTSKCDNYMPVFTGVAGTYAPRPVMNSEPVTHGGIGIQLFVSISACLGACLSITVSTDGLYAGVGGAGSPGFSLSVGGATTPGGNQRSYSVGGCGAIVVGGCGFAGVSKQNNPYVGGAVTFGTGLYFGPQKTFTLVSW